MDSIVITNQEGERIVLGNQAPFYLEILDGIGEVNVNLESQKAPGQDGSTYIGNTVENRLISIEGMIITKKGEQEMLKARRLMQRVLNPKLDGLILTYRQDEQAREITARVETTPVFPNGRGLKGPYHQKFLFHLVCHQPFWCDVYFESREMSYLMGGIKFRLSLPTGFSSRGFRRKCINEGDVPTPVMLEFKGPAINPTVNNLTTGEFIRVNRGLNESDLLTINTAFGEKFVRVNGENAFHYIDLNSTFWQLGRGENYLDYESNNDSIRTRVVVRWKNRYVGL